MTKRLKKLIATLLAVGIIGVSMVGCNQQLVDTTYKFDKAIISLPNGEVIEGEIESWKDYEGTDQIQVKINGMTYFCHHSDVVLIKEAAE